MRLIIVIFISPQHTTKWRWAKRMKMRSKKKRRKEKNEKKLAFFSFCWNIEVVWNESKCWSTVVIFFFRALFGHFDYILFALWIWFRPFALYHMDAWLQFVHLEWGHLMECFSCYLNSDKLRLQFRSKPPAKCNDLNKCSNGNVVSWSVCFQFNRKKRNLISQIFAATIYME